MANLINNVFFNATRTDVAIADYRSVPFFCDCGVDFHWWDNRATGKHAHNHYEIFIVTSGLIAHTINGSQSVLPKNTMRFIYPDDVHIVAPFENSPCMHINLAFIPEKLAAFSAALGFCEAETLENIPKEAALSDEEMNFFLSRAEEINLLKSNSASDPAVAVLTAEMIIEALSVLYRRRYSRSPLVPDWLTSFLQRLHSPEILSASVSELYALTNYSPQTIAKYFKRYVGRTLVEYFTEIKMQHAKQLLRSTPLSVLEISERLGYDSLSHFIKVFKRFNREQTPREYRNSPAVNL